MADGADIKDSHTFHFGFKTVLHGAKFSNISCPASMNLVHHSLAKLQVCIKLNYQKGKKTGPGTMLSYLAKADAEHYEPKSTTLH